MAEWRFLRGWSDEELAMRLAAARDGRRNFDESVDDLTPERGWSRHYSEAVIAREPSGPPQHGGPFARAWPLLERYAFSDPDIVQGHFDGDAPLHGRVMLLEAKVLGLRYLGAAIVAAVRNDSDDRRSERGFRYETLEGHFERGAEWFTIIKDHRSGAVMLRIDAGWRRGQLPNAWSRLGFRLLARHYQRKWHRRAHLRMRALLGSVGLDPLPRGARLLHHGVPLPTDVDRAAEAVIKEPIASADETPTHRTVEVS